MIDPVDRTGSLIQRDRETITRRNNNKRTFDMEAGGIPVGLPLSGEVCAEIPEVLKRNGREENHWRAARS